MSKATILIADDDRVILNALVKGLRERGYETLQASDGEQALSRCEQHRVDLALLDVNMPKLGGIEVARQLAKNGDLPVLFLSAYNSEPLVQQAVEEGALGYLIKPLDTAQVTPSIEAALGLSRQLRKLRDTAIQLNTALGRGRETSVAIGLLMERHRLTEQEAFQSLRTAARSQRRKMPEVAAEVVRAAELINVCGHREKRREGL